MQSTCRVVTHINLAGAVEEFCKDNCSCWYCGSTEEEHELFEGPLKDSEQSIHSGSCPHGQKKSHCKECSSSGMCLHSQQKQFCKEVWQQWL